MPGVKVFFITPGDSKSSEVMAMNRLTTTLLLSLLTVLMVLMGSALGGKSGMIAAFVIALGMNFFSYWFSDKIVLKEYLADETGARICGRPLELANALCKLHVASHSIPMQEARPASAHMFIVNPLTGGSLLSLFSTHPPMEERIARLEVMSRTST